MMYNTLSMHSNDKLLLGTTHCLTVELSTSDNEYQRMGSDSSRSSVVHCISSWTGMQSTYTWGIWQYVHTMYSILLCSILNQNYPENCIVAQFI